MIIFSIIGTIELLNKSHATMTVLCDNKLKQFIWGKLIHKLVIINYKNLILNESIYSHIHSVNNNMHTEIARIFNASQYI